MSDKEQTNWAVAIVMIRTEPKSNKVDVTTQLVLSQYRDCIREEAIGLATVEALNKHQGFNVSLVSTLAVQPPNPVAPGQVAVSRADLEKVLGLAVYAPGMPHFGDMTTPEALASAKAAADSLRAVLQDKA